MNEALLSMSKMMDIMYDAYEKKMAREEWEKERAKEDASSTS